MATQLELFSSPPEPLPQADESLEALLEDWDIKSDGTLVRRRPVPFTRRWHDEQIEAQR